LYLVAESTTGGEEKPILNLTMIAMRFMSKLGVKFANPADSMWFRRRCRTADIMARLAIDRL
jgi:hypothetical protein